MHMRSNRSQNMVKADRLAAAALNRALIAWRAADGPRCPQPDAMRQFSHYALAGAKVRPGWLMHSGIAWLRQQPELVMITICLGLCMVGTMHS